MVFAATDAARSVVTISTGVAVVLAILGLDKVSALVRLFSLDLGVENGSDIEKRF